MSTALIIGATGSLGAACARILHASMPSLILHGRRGSAISSLTAELSGSMGLSYSFDGRNTEGFLALLKTLPPPEVLVFALGPFLSAPLAETRAQQWENLCALNLALPGALVSALLPGMTAQGRGRILLFGASRGDQARGYRRTAAYASAKAGLSVLARSLALEYADHGVSCTLVCPGVLEESTPGAPQSGRWRAFSAEMIAREALRLALHPEGLYNGAIIPMDGGMDLS